MKSTLTFSLSLPGEGPKSRANITIIEPADPVCPETEIGGITWTVTVAGGVNVQDCKDGMIGKCLATHIVLDKGIKLFGYLFVNHIFTKIVNFKLDLFL